MALFRRKSSATDPAVAIAEFWAAWPELRGPLGGALDAEEDLPHEVTARLDERTRRIHSTLTWEVSRVADPLGDLGLDDLSASLSDSALADLAELDNLDSQGAASSATAETTRYSLTLTGGTNDTARVLAERWRQGAPADAEWKFHPARQPDHDQLAATMTWQGHELDLSHASVALRVNQSAVKIEASVFHPDFMFLAEETQHAVARNITLLAIGEDDLVRWIGSIHPLTEKPLDPLPPASMPSVVRQLSGALGSGGWVVAQGRIPVGGPFEISLRHPLSRRDFPAFTLYVLVTVPYANSGSDRLPAASSVDALAEFGATLSEVLGDHGALFAHRTMGGQRQFHFYLDPESGVLPDLEQALDSWQEGRASLSSFLDPDWQAIEQLAKPLRRKLGR